MYLIDVSGRKCIFVSAVNIRFDYINWASQRERGESVQRGATRFACFFFFFLSIAQKIWRGSRKHGLEKVQEEGEKRIKRRYTTARVGRNREVETGSRQRYILFPPLFLSFSRESQFSLQPTGHGSIVEGETTSRRWTRVGGRNVEKEGETTEKKRERKKGRKRERRGIERAKDGDKACQLAWARIITFTSGRRSVCAGGLIKFARLIRLFVDCNVRFGN